MNEWSIDVDRRIYKGITVGIDRGFIKPADPIVIVTGWKPGSGSTNTMRVIYAIDPRLGEELAPITGVSSVPSFGTLPSITDNRLPENADREGESVRFF